MTEIEKLFENAGIENYRLENFVGLCPIGYKIICYENEPDKVKEVVKDFTAEKQIKIIQLLSKIRGDIQLCSDIQCIFVVNFETSKCQWANKYHDKLDEALADMVNVLWQSLTDQEKEEIRNILNE